LYPEDHAIPVEELIECWIAEELIAGMNSVEAQFDKGRAIVRKLTSTCLLESFTEELGVQCLRMHDLIRDMALRIASSSPRFMVKAGVKQESVPDEDWPEDLEKISFMYSQIRELPIRPPVCPQLITLLLNGTGLEEIPDSFFTYMPRLEVLDLSDNKIKSLPVSISNLENLHALILARCHQLTDVPSLETLKALKVFILTSSSIEEVPEGIEELVNLTKLDLSNNNELGMFPGWKLRRLLKLQILRIDGTELHVRVEDLLFLRKLKVVAVQFVNVNGLSRYVTSQQFQSVEMYRLLTGGGPGGIDGPPIDKEVCIRSKSEPFRSDQLVLPADVDSFQLEAADNLTCLSAIPSLKDARYLSRCVIRSCDGLESIFSSSSLSGNGQISLGTIESLDLSELPRFRVLFDGIAPPLRIYFNLKELYISQCETLENILPVQFLQNFPNLTSLNVEKCENVEDIIVEIAEMSDRGNHQDDIKLISLPKLKSLQLWDLPRLKSIYNGDMVCPSLEEVDVHGCPMVRRLPLSLHMDSEQATAPPSLKYIRGKEEWWESLEWDDAFTKTVLQSSLEISSY
jgi:disease resistance protein RPS2